MHQTCKRCSKTFEITPDDLAFYGKLSPLIGGKKFEIPAPKLCPPCRQQRRFAFRNEGSLHRRQCNKTGETILSMYPAEAPFPVYSPHVWFGDSWDARSYGRDFDFNRPFFEQFLELRNAVPHLSLISSNNENCDYCNIVGSCKNCYLIFGSIESENCYYGNPFRCKDCCDSLLLRNSELCLECVDSNHLYNCYACQNCTDSSDLILCDDVKNSQHCFACVGLNRKEYHILNKPYSKEEYEAFLKDFDFSNEENWGKMQENFRALKLSTPHKYYFGFNNENVSGNFIFDSKNCMHSFNVEKCQDMKYVYQMLVAKDCVDCANGEYGELDYEVMAFFNNVNNVSFSYFVWDNVYNVHYSAHCTQNVQNCFGCMGLKKAAYCILNKQYTKQEYEALVPRIIEHMKNTGEWGEFFPMELSPFPYTATVAQEFYPAAGAENLDKPFKIIPQEAAFYERWKLPLPTRAPRRRHLDRLAMRNPTYLWQRACAQCGVTLQSSYSPDRPEIVYCDACYLAQVY